MASVQRTLCEDDSEGFQYKDGILSADQERTLIALFGRLPFREFEFRGFLGKRRTVSFGWLYDFNVRELQQAEEIPSFLLAIRQKAAAFAGITESRLQHALVTEYAPGAAIGWHRDRPEFEDVIGISLGAPCLFRFRRKNGMRWERASIELQLVRPTFCAGERAGIGNTASRPLTSCVIPSPSEACLSRKNEQ
jgi:alkylated DNA repair dioxygenase AlkB